MARSLVALPPDEVQLCASLCDSTRRPQRRGQTVLQHNASHQERESAPSPAERVNESTVGNLSVGDDTAANVRVFLQ